MVISGLSGLVRVSILPALVLFILLVRVAPAIAGVPLEEFLRDPVIGTPALSPSGRYLAVPTTPDHRGVGTVFIHDLDAPAPTPKGTNVPKGFRLDWVQWASDARLLIGLTQILRTRPAELELEGTSRVIAVDPDGRQPVSLFSNLRSLKGVSDLTGLLHLLPDDQAHVLMQADDEYGRRNVYRVNVINGEAEKIEGGSRGTFSWLTDLQGRLRFRWDGDTVTERVDVKARIDGADDWTTITQYRMGDLPSLKIIGFGDDPVNAIVASRGNGDRYAVYEYNVVSKSLGRLLFQNANVDVGLPVGGPIHDPRTQKLLGLAYVDDLAFTHWFDPSLAKAQATLERFFEAEAGVEIVSWSDGRSRFVARTSGPRNPGKYFLYEVANSEVSPIGDVRPSLTPAGLGDTTVIKFSARDGARIPGYLTLPAGKPAKGLPLVVFPHGGPETRDYVRFDPWVQFMVSRGYAVFQPNFRGSGGYGRAFLEQGHRQFGLRMQDDVTDGVKALIADGTADASRICIVGASYGGYAALAGGAFTPELYRCVVSIAGLSDLELQMQDMKNVSGRDSYSMGYWRKWLGDPDVPEDLAGMRAVSPAFHADKFRAPVLLIHGDQDSVVRWNQSVRMDKALFKAGKKSKLVLLATEGHPEFSWFARKRMFTELEVFLAEHLGK